MKRITGFIIVVSALAVGATVAVAGDPIKERKELMKGVGKATKLSAQMVKGQVPFDGGQAAEAMKTINAAAEKFPTLFPKGSETGGETEASPKIWSDMEGFKTAAEKLEKASAAGVDAAANGEGAFKQAFGAMVKNCKSCHEGYRIKKKQ